MKGTKIINWGTPRQIQQLKAKDDPMYRSGRKSKVCKFYKGEHIFDQTDAYYLFGKHLWTTMRCRCGKKGKIIFSEKKL